MKKVIILEDEEILGKIYKKKLEEAGFEVFWKKTIVEIEELITQIKSDIVLIDHGIRGYEKSGIDIIPNVRKNIPNAKIIMLSNYSQQELQKKAIELGASAFLIKLNTPPKVLVNFLQNL